MLTPNWTDFYPTDLGVVIGEMFSYVGDNLSYYVDRVSNENYLPTCTTRDAIIKLGALIGYKLGSGSSAVVTVSFTCTSSGTIPAGTIVQTDTAGTSERQYTFVTKVDVVAPGAGVVDVECIEGTLVASEILGSSSGMANQKLSVAKPISYDPTGTTSLKVFVDEGGGATLWAEVTNFLNSGSTDKHYIVNVDASGSAAVRFGNGVDGQVPASGSSNVTCSYRTGGGVGANSVGTGKVTKLGSTLAFVSSVTNAAQPQGGSELESVEEARVRIPASLSALDRAVTFSDFERLSLKVSGTSQAKALEGIGPYEVVVYVSATGSSKAATGTWNPRTETGTGLLGNVGAYLNTRKAAPTKLVMRSPLALSLEARIDLTVKETYFQANVKTDATQKLLDTIEAYRMGQSIYLSDILAALESVDGVDNVAFRRWKRKEQANLRNPDPSAASTVPDTVWVVGTVTYGDEVEEAAGTLRPTLDQKLTVTFISPTEYHVVSDLQGRQSSVGVKGAEWSSDDGTYKLHATNPTVTKPDYAGYWYEIILGAGRVGQRIVVDTYEIATLAKTDVSFVKVSGGIS
jgi:hypothetical protein